MNSLTDLRTTLDRQADQVSDAETVVRATAVRHRVAAVRRRRRAVGSGALALVVAATVGVLGLHRASADSAPVVFGVQAPKTMTSLGYTYQADGWVHTVDGSGSVKIAASDRPRLISWTLQGTPTVRFVLPNGEIWHSGASRFRDFVALAAGQSGTLQVAAGHGRAGVTTYDLTDAAPDGYTKDGITFRQTVAGAQLLGAVISDPGQTDVSTSYPGTRGQIGITLVCTGLPHGDVVHVSFNGSERTAGDCSTDDTFDPGSQGGSRALEADRGQVALRVWVTDGYESKTVLPVGSVPRLRMAVGVYGPVGITHLTGGQVPTVVEQDGHTWHLASVHESPTGTPIDIDPVRRQMVAQMTWHAGPKRAQVVFRATGMTDAGGSVSSSGSAGIGDLWVPAGASVHAAFVHGHGRFSVAYYQRAD